MPIYFPLNTNNVVARTQPMTIESGFRFPTTKEIEQAVADLTTSFDQRNPLIDRFFPVSNTFASEIEMYMVRTQDGNDRGMTLVHQIGSNALPTEVRATRFDLAKASWSPLAFKEARTWDEKEMLYLGTLTEEAQKSKIDEQIANYLVYMMRRMQNRKDWMLWQVMRTGKIVIDANDPNNPNNLQYTVDYNITDLQLPLVDKFDAFDAATGKSLTNPIEYFQDMRKYARWHPEKMPVALVVNSTFPEILADNTFIQYHIDYERGWTAVDMRPPREVYLERALEVFKRHTKLDVLFVDDTYEDANGTPHYWLPNGEMIVVNQNTAPFGEFKYTAHIAGSANGKVTLGTGPYMHVYDETQGDPPMYKIVGGFHGLPQITGYNPSDFTYHRWKWLQYAETATVESHQVPFPTKPVVGQ